MKIAAKFMLMLEQRIRCAGADTQDRGFSVKKYGSTDQNLLMKICDNYLDNYRSPAMADREVWIKIGAHEVEILTEDYQSIVKHRRLYGKNLEVMNWYPYLTTLAKRPNALKYSGFYRELPEIWQDYLTNCDYQGKKSSLKVLIKILEESDMDTADRSLAECMAQGTATSEGIIFSYYRLTQESMKEQLLLPESLISLDDYALDLNTYDLLLQKVM